MKHIRDSSAIIVAVFAVSCSGAKQFPSEDWIIAPESVDVTQWAAACGARFATAPDPWAKAPMEGLTEWWSGNGSASCHRNWHWDNSVHPLVKNVRELSVSAHSEAEVVKLVSALFEPILPATVHPQLHAVIRRPFTPVPIDVRGFSFSGGYQESSKAWFVVVGRTPGADPDR